MNLDKIIEEIKKEGEEELKKLKDENDKYIQKVNVELEKELKNIENKWNEYIEKEKRLLIEKKENELKLELDLIELNRKNKVLNEFFNYIVEKLNNISDLEKKDFFKKEILKVVEKGNETVHFDKDSLKNIFNDEFRKDIIKNIEKKIGRSDIKFVEDKDTFVEGEGFISRISLKDKFKEIWNDILLNISKRIF
ncbi:MAG: hypothetical protein ACP5KX_06185 [Caldisericia bacterium]